MDELEKMMVALAIVWLIAFITALIKFMRSWVTRRKKNGVD